MIHFEHQQFLEVLGDRLSLKRGEKAIYLRKLLGASLDKRLSIYPKGVIQQQKNKFIELAMALTGVRWKSQEPYRIFSTLKNKGDGDEEMVCALLFLSWKTIEFDDLRNVFERAFRDQFAENQSLRQKLPKVEFSLPGLLGNGRSVNRATQQVLLNNSFAMQLKAAKGEIFNSASPVPDNLESTFEYLLDNPIEHQVHLGDVDQAFEDVVLRNN